MGKPAYGMPLMVEPLVMQANSQAGGYMVDGDAQKIVTLVRLARERLGGRLAAVEFRHRDWFALSLATDELVVLGD